MTLSSEVSARAQKDQNEGLSAGLNLIRDRWIPVRRKDGTVEKIRPAEVLDFGPDGENPPVAVAAVRPDFNSALIQFLIGIFQTAVAPKREGDWRKTWKNRPTVDAMQREFDDFAHAFEVEPNAEAEAEAEVGSALFMQDLDPLESQKPKPVIQLLLDTPAGQTLKFNKDHFTKDRGEQYLCPDCTLLSLLALQLNAPGGGAGHRTSLRGGGPLNTIILGRNLWETVWLNILPTKNRSGWTELVSNDLGDVFPWLEPTRTSDDKKGGTNTTPVDVHPAQIYWNMPRRIRLLSPKNVSGQESCCELCGEPSERLYSEYKTQNYGVNYEGAWVHPLTPYSILKDGSPNPAKGQPGGLSYRHWRGYVANFEDGNQSPAEVVTQFLKRGESSLAEGDELFRFQPRLWAFGYDADNAKIRSWHESTMPLYLLPEGLYADFEQCAIELVAAADFVVYVLGNALKNALFGEPEVSEKGKVTWRVADGVNAKKSFFQQINMSFWQQTESAFYAALEEVKAALLAGTERLPIRENWRKVLQDEAMGTFDSNSQFGSFYGADPKAVVLARRNLRLSSSAHNKKLRELLDLPKPEKSKTPEEGK